MLPSFFCRSYSQATGVMSKKAGQLNSTDEVGTFMDELFIAERRCFYTSNCRDDGGRERA